MELLGALCDLVIAFVVGVFAALMQAIRRFSGRPPAGEANLENVPVQPVMEVLVEANPLWFMEDGSRVPAYEMIARHVETRVAGDAVPSMRELRRVLSEGLRLVDEQRSLVSAVSVWHLALRLRGRMLKAQQSLARKT